ncbi:SLAM family member 7-like isoform 2-T2 [Geothlypis trichas]
MDVFWIPLLTILVLFHQTTSASDTMEVIGAVGGSVTFHSHNPGRNVALWNFGDDPIVTVVFKDPPRLIFFEDKFETRFAVSDNGHELSISQLRMEDAGTYSVTIGDKRSTFTLQVFRELAEPTVTCETQNCSGGICSSSLRCSVPGTDFGNVSYTWSLGGHTWDGSSVVLLVNETSQEELEPLMCTARNPVSSRNVTVTTLGALCAAITTHPPSPGAHSGSWIRIGVIAGVEVAALLSICLVSYCKYKGYWPAPHSQVGAGLG